MNCISLTKFREYLMSQLLVLVYVWCSPREIRQGEEIAWYADGDTIVRNEHNPSIAYAYGIYLFSIKRIVLHSLYLLSLCRGRK